MAWKHLLHGGAFFFCALQTNILLAANQPSTPASTTPAPATPAPTTQAPAPSAPMPQFPPAPGAIVTGLTGLVTATQSGLNNYRATKRVMLFRQELTQVLLKPDLDLGKPISLGPSNEAMLCSMRGPYATLAADAAYIGSVTTTLNKFATPPSINTIGDAFVAVFQNYTIDSATGKLTPAKPATVLKNCQTDIDAWPTSYYGAPLNRTASLAQGVGDPSAILGTFSDLLTLLNTILTPIITGGAKAIVSAERAEQITAYLETPKIRDNLISAATDLAIQGNALATATRLQALGQFEEKMATARTIQIDLSKIAACKIALTPAPAVPPAATNSPLSNSDGVANIPTDNFVSCYSQAWQQLNDSVQAAVTAAGQYDSLADLSSDQLTKKNFGDLKNTPPTTLAQLVNAATQLITYGQSVTQALSQANLTKVETDVKNLMTNFK